MVSTAVVSVYCCGFCSNSGRATATPVTAGRLYLVDGGRGNCRGYELHSHGTCRRRVGRTIGEGTAALGTDKTSDAMRARRACCFPKVLKASNIDRQGYRITRAPSLYLTCNSLCNIVRNGRYRVSVTRGGEEGLVAQTRPRVTCLLYTSPSPRD